jgi:hypothetical protein
MKGTLNVDLHYVCTPIHKLRGFCDVDWASFRDDKHFIIGFAIFLGDNLIS